MIISTCVLAQSSIDIPNSVCLAFANSSKANKFWGKKNKTEFKNKKNSDRYDESGVLSRSAIEIKSKKLPTEILTDIQKRYKGYTIFESYKIFDRTDGISYEVEIIKGKADFKLVYDVTGKLVKESDLFTKFLWDLLCAAM